MQLRKLTLGLILFAGIAISAQAQTTGDQAVFLARQYFRTNTSKYGISDADRDLALRNVRNRTNQFVIRFDQRYRNLKVFEGEAIARVSNGQVDVTNALRPNLNVDTQPSIFGFQAVATVLRAIGLRAQANTSSSLEILPQGRIDRDTLVWHVTVDYSNETDGVGSWNYFVDAKSGAIVWSFNSLTTESAQTTAIGKTMYSGDVTITVNFSNNTYSLVNPGQGGAPGNSTNDAKAKYDVASKPFTSPVATFGDNNKANTDPNTGGADAAYGLQNTWSFYGATFGRNGIDDNGTRTFQKVHFGKNYENAFWSDGCFCMTYGDGASEFYPLVSLDVAGHEMSHGVTASEANLTYAGESGGLNESTSDIFGTMVEFFANNPVDVPDYWIGERIVRANYPGGVYTETTALRFMDDPHKDGTSPACWSATVGSLNVHYSSGPSNHMFYLLSHGGTSKCNGQVVAGIGNSKASQIWYRALTTYMTSSTDYHGARAAAISAATDLYGAGSTEVNMTSAAFAAINVN